MPVSVSTKLLRYAYPPMPQWDAKLARVELAALTGRVVGLTDGRATVRYEGKAEVVFPYTGKPTDGRLTRR